jgi:hypothetical protein
MGKHNIFFLPCALLALLMACSQQTNQPDEGYPIRLHLSFAAGPSESTLFYPGRAQQAGLGKTARLVEDQVLLLHCDDESLTVATDASAYHNDFYLNYVKYDTSASTALKKALAFEGSRAYALSESYGTMGGELNGTHGLELSFRMFMTGTASYYEQRIFDRHDTLGGFTVGISSLSGAPEPRLFFRIKQNGAVITAPGKTVLKSRQWYKVTARYDQSNLTLLLDDAVESTTPATGQITASSRATILGAGWSGDAIGYRFQGRLDEISLRTKVEYEDLEMIRLAVFDFSEYSSEDDFYSSEAYHHYQMAIDDMAADSSYLPTWDAFSKLWEKYFKVVSNQNLVINGAFAEGTVRGVEGMNGLVVSGIKDGIMTYFGQAFALVSGEGTTDVWMPIYRYGNLGY